MIIASLLFVPFRYKIDAQLYDSANIKVSMSWFLHAFSFVFKYKKGENDKYIRILGIRTSLMFGKNKDTDPPNNNKSNSKKKSKKKYDDYGYDAENDKDIFEDMNESIAKKDYKHYSLPENIIKNDDVIELFSEETFEEKKKSIFEKIKEKIEKVIKCIRKITFKIKHIYAKIKEVVHGLISIKEFLQLEETKEAFGFVKEQIFKVLRYIKPRKVTGQVHFGTGDPALTGKILGAIYCINKGPYKKFIIEADFDNMILEGNVHLKGHVTLFSLLLVGIKIYFNKNLKSTINKGKMLKENEYG